jgi:hypothetical protein
MLRMRTKIPPIFYIYVLAILAMAAVAILRIDYI